MYFQIAVLKFHVPIYIEEIIDISSELGNIVLHYPKRTEQIFTKVYRVLPSLILNLNFLFFPQR